MSLNGLTIEKYLDDLASDKPAPGGGAAVAICGAQAVALLSMSLAVSGDNLGKLPVAQRTALIQLLDQARKQFLDLGNRDAAAFATVMTCYGMPKNSDNEKTLRKEALQAAFTNATEIPFATMELAAEMMDNAKDVVLASKASVISDAAIGIDFLYSTLKACQHNVRINLKYIQDDNFKESAENRMALLTEGRKKQRQALNATIREIISK